MSKVKIYIKSILIPVILGAITGFIISKFMNYDNLVKPSFAPPSFLFPIAWSIFYILMGVSYGILESNSLADDSIKTIYYSQLVVNLIWPILFFVFKARLISFIWILLLLVLVFIMVKKFYNKNKVAGLLQIPYLLWTIFASFLNLSLYLLNK